MFILQDDTYPEMFWVVWPDGIRSGDFYNKSRANDFKRRFEEYHRRYPNRTPEEASRSLTGEFK